MINKKPKRKLEKFIEDLRKAKTKEEMKKIAEKIYNYAYIENDITAFIQVADLYTALGELEKATNTIEILEKAGYNIPRISIIKAKLLISKGYLKGALNLFSQVWKNPKVDEKDRIEAFAGYIATLVITLRNYEKAIQEIKEFGLKDLEEFNNFILEKVPDYLFDLMTEVYHYLKRWEQAKEFIERHNLSPLISKVEQKVEKYNHILSYTLDYDYEDPVKKLDVYVNLEAKGIDKEELLRLENELIELSLDVEPEIYITVEPLKELYV